MKLLFLLLLPLVFSHFTLTWPPNRMLGTQETAGTCVSDKNVNTEPGRNGTCLWFNYVCEIGCEVCTPNKDDLGTHTGCVSKKNQPFDPMIPEWARSWNNFTVPGDSKMNPLHRNFDAYKMGLSTYFPWFYPGTAPIWSPCGVAGGSPHNFNGPPESDSAPPKGIQRGMDGRDLPPNPDAENIWERGTVEEVSYSIVANHGGGDSYRLCKKSEDPFHFVTEECFQMGALNYHGNKSWIQYGADRNNRTEIDTVRITVDGIQWSRIPIPGCGDSNGGYARGMTDYPTSGILQAGDECTRPQFKPPVEGLFGMGLTQCEFPPNPDTKSNVGLMYDSDRVCTDEFTDLVKERWNVNIVDLVEIPDDIEPGEYVLSWRHDCEQSPQIWSSCADITIL